MTDERLRIIVAGYVVRGPLGGLAWHHLQYVLGLARLGHEVTFIEDSDDYPSCWDPEREQMSTDPGFGLRFAGRVFDRFGLGERWAYHDAHTSRWLGPLAEGWQEACRRADLLLNLSGVNPLRPWLARIPARALIDTDPVFTQLRHLRDAEALAEAERHTAFFSFGENLGRPKCSAPKDGLDWRPSRQPVVLDAWTVTPGPARGPFTTVMQWESYPAIHHAGRRYGVKAASFEPYVDLPRRTGEVLELALGSAEAPRDRLREHGWRLRDPFPPTRDPWAFQSYVRSSKGELSIAKQAYVESSSGWFSERSTGYLASGRPVLVQDTGFTEWLPSGEGIVAFSSPDEALAGLETINGAYRRHCGAARELAAEYFDAQKVLPQLLERAMARSRPDAVRTGVHR